MDTRSEQRNQLDFADGATLEAKVAGGDGFAESQMEDGSVANLRNGRCREAVIFSFKGLLCNQQPIHVGLREEVAGVERF